MAETTSRISRSQLGHFILLTRSGSGAGTLLAGPAHLFGKETDYASSCSVFHRLNCFDEPLDVFIVLDLQRHDDGLSSKNWIPTCKLEISLSLFMEKRKALRVIGFPGYPSLPLAFIVGLILDALGLLLFHDDRVIRMQMAFAFLHFGIGPFRQLEECRHY